METHKAFSCYLIGADTLLTECGEQLLAADQQILGVVSDTPRLQQWAHDHQLPAISLQDDIVAQLSKSPFDYLFSITHLELLPDAILTLPQKMSVNFHDGPLPRYAGINAPAWALLNRETSYGITWHEISSEVDKGDILQQQFFEIAADETAVSINTKCFAAALDSFPKLIEELATGTEQRQSQNFSERSYFAKHRRPVNTGVIDWTAPAVDIEALVRALDFGDYANPLGSAQCIFQGQHYLVTRAQAVAEVANQPPGPPGYVVAINDQSIQVATGEGVLNILALRTITGEVFESSKLVSVLATATNPHFEIAKPDELSKLNEMGAGLSKQEHYWRRQLSQVSAISVPFSNATETAGNSPSKEQIDLEIIGSANTVIGSFCLMLMRLTQQQQLDAVYCDRNLASTTADVQRFVSPVSLLSINLDTAQDATISATDLAALVEKQINELGNKGSWLHDIQYREATLRALPNLRLGPSTIGVINGGNADYICGLDNTELVLQVATSTSAAKLHYNPQRYTLDAIRTLKSLLEHLNSQVVAEPTTSIQQLGLLSSADTNKILHQWNQTEKNYDRTVTIHQLFEEQAQIHPTKTALVFEDDSISYADLDNKADKLAQHLQHLGVGSGSIIGVNIDRCIDLMVTTLGIMKAGAAYLPLDPMFPAERITYMIEDAGVDIIVSQQHLLTTLNVSSQKVLCIDSDWPTIIATSATESKSLQTDTKADDLAYVIYTSGSTGNPKGVMIEHHNATNFFVGMDDHIPHDDASTWLAVTSLSFDISVLELFWTLTRGLKVVIYKDTNKLNQTTVPDNVSQQPMDFGLFMWGNDDAPGKSKYRLMLEGAKYFDANGFNAVWTPERHFHAFGGPYPNPAVTSAAIATITENIAIRSGSCVSPLHHPIRIAEDWAVVDNLSNGRVGLAFAAGWQPNDFVLRPENHANNKAIMFEQIETVKKLWRGEAVPFENPLGQMVETLTLPRPVQAELPIWVTIAGNPDSYRQAGSIGANVLTHLLGQSVEELAEKTSIYRQARKEAGYDPDAGSVALMLHTLVGENTDVVRELVREPMKDYLRSSMKLVIDFAWSFPAFQIPGHGSGNQAVEPDDVDLNTLTEEDSETILDFAFERYFETSGLFGTLDKCQDMVNRCKRAGVDEIACLLDFGVATEEIMSSLPLLKDVRDAANPQNAMTEDQSEVAAKDLDSFSFANLISNENVTHIQCTPSHARMLCFSDEDKLALATLQHMFIGGEAIPSSLAKELKTVLKGTLTNMYGPTETTIWSTVQRIENPDDITIGRPIANTKIYILDQHKQPVPAGVPGNLYIGGEGVARGYLHRTELTAQRFVDNVLSPNADEKMYWTGDLARYREDGTIDFLGRADFQVKIRGYRIELGEIESLVGAHDQVHENVLLLREDTPGDQRLTAYLIATTQGSQNSNLVEELKGSLRDKLPEYMIPSDFVVLDRLPLTPNGKIDRNALPAPHSIEKQSSAEFAPPEDELETTIADLWQSTLKIDKVGIDDNFFDMGGHSLLIVRLHALMKTAIEQKVSLTDLYAYPTIRSLSSFLQTGGDTATLQKSADRAQRRRQTMSRRRR